MEKSYLFSSSVLLCMLSYTLVTTEGALDFGYHNYDEMHAFIKDLLTRYPNLTRTYSIGESVQGRDLTVLMIGSRPQEHVPGRPDVKYVGNMHGNEITNRELLLHLAEHLLNSYGKNATLTSFLDSTRVHILPTMNPDGAEDATTHPYFLDGYTRWNGTSDATHTKAICEGSLGRNNKNGWDLNRNFPDYFEGNKNSPRQPETLAIMDWLRRYQFVLSANLHGGALLANTPLDSYIDAIIVYYRKANYSASVDDDVFRHLARTYSYSHRSMHRGLGCPGPSPGSFPEGIVNGAQWYPVIGGMQDYNYIYSGCMELTLELHCCKFAPVPYIVTAWEENKDALINYLYTVHMGVKGTVRDNVELEMKDAEVRVKGREFFVLRTTPTGEFWRLLLPGTYTLMVSATGYQEYETDVVVKEGIVTVVNIIMLRRSDYGPRFKQPKETCFSNKAAYHTADPCWLVLVAVLIYVTRSMKEL